jgi:hypothetical protein
MNRFLGAAIVLAILILAAAVTVIGLRPTPVRTVTHTVVQTRTVTPSPRVIIRYRAAAAPSPAPSPSPAAAPSPAASLPYGVTAAGAGYPAGSYFINCANRPVRHARQPDCGTIRDHLLAAVNLGIALQLPGRNDLLALTRPAAPVGHCE